MIFDKFKIQVPDLDPQETSEWIESIDSVIEHFGPDRAKYILTELIRRARNSGVDILPPSVTPYLNTISPDQEPEYPGDEKIEKNKRIHIIRNERNYYRNWDHRSGLNYDITHYLASLQHRLCPSGNSPVWQYSYERIE